jgi:hypothetical protein
MPIRTPYTSMGFAICGIFFHSPSLPQSIIHFETIDVLMLFGGCSGPKSGRFGCHKVNTNQYILLGKRGCKSDRTWGRFSWHGNIRLAIQGITWLHTQCEVWMHCGVCTMSKKGWRLKKEHPTYSTKSNGGRFAIQVFSVYMLLSRQWEFPSYHFHFDHARTIISF